MLDLTGANLISYLIRVTKDVMNRSPRFRNALGEVTFASNNQINFGDVQMLVKNVTTQGTRLSPDYFICTRHGFAILAKVEDKDGQFVEFVTETVNTNPNPNIDPGVYYLNVDSVSEQTREVGLTIKKYKWRQGKITNAFGSLVYFAPGIDASAVTLSELNNPSAAISFSAFGNYLILYTAIENLVITSGSPPRTLTANVDYWAVRQQSQVIIQSTKGGPQQELASVPTAEQGKLVFTDQNGYELREGIDFSYLGPDWIQLSSSSPVGSTITATGSFRSNISQSYGSMNPENLLPVNLLPGEILAPGEVFIQTSQGAVFNVSPTAAGDIQLPVLLPPGGYAFYEVRIDTGVSTTVTAHKQELNGAIIPGLWVAIGDRVVVDDQVAVIVSPTMTETYQVYGSKENLNFTLEVKANDLQTASDFTELLKQELLVWRKMNMSADGVEIFEVSREYQGEQRDPSGTAPRYLYSLRVEASCDWRVFVPLVTRFVSYQITNTVMGTNFPGALQAAPLQQALGAMSFIPAYA